MKTTNLMEGCDNRSYLIPHPDALKAFKRGQFYYDNQHVTDRLKAELQIAWENYYHFLGEHRGSFF